MEDNKIRNIKQREKFIKFKGFKEVRGSEKRIRLSSITHYHIKESSLIIHIDGNSSIQSFNYKDFEAANNALDKLDYFFNITEI